MSREISLITQKLKERIIKTLAARYNISGITDPVPWRGIWIELGVAEDEFCEALHAAAEECPQASIIIVDSDHIMLNVTGQSDAKLARERTGSLDLCAAATLKTKLLSLFSRV